MAVAPQPSAGPAAKKRGKLPLIVVCLVGISAGAGLPMVVNVPALLGKKVEAKPKPKHDHNTVAIPFGDVVVNLAEDRMNRYLRMKIALKVDEEEEKAAILLVTKHKAALKSKLISYLSGKSLKDVSGSVGVNKLQREILERFEDILYPDAESRLREVLFEEYVVQ
jgi:flagellar basal body-associated protein FliL